MRQDKFTIKSQEAIRKAQNYAQTKGKQQVDVAVVDQKMPDMDGLQVIEKLKERNPGIKTILLTGHGDTYRWMVKTVEEGPTPGTLEPHLKNAGFKNIEIRYPTGGAAYLIVATR